MNLPPKPTYQFDINLVSNIPDQLQDLDQFVLWKYELNKDKVRWTKVLYQPHDLRRRASTTNPETWDPLGTALEAYARHSESQDAFHMDGLGFVLTSNGGIVGGDLDHVISGGEIYTSAQEILEYVLPTYHEISPSGEGIRFLCEGKLPGKGMKRPELELYDSGRYVTITGKALDDCRTLENRQDGVLELYRRFNGKAHEGNGHHHGEPPKEEDKVLLDKARSARNSEKFIALFDRGEIPDGKSPSEADFRLCCHLAFWWNRDTTSIDRMFRQSALMRDKWDEKRGPTTYGAWTIQEAIRVTDNVYQPQAPLAPLVNRHGEEKTCVVNTELWLQAQGWEIRQDTFLHNVFIDGEPLSDDLVTRIAAQIEREKRIPWHQTVVRSALVDVGYAHRGSCLVEYLNSLYWDGTPRISRFFADQFNAEQSEYTAAVAKMFFVGAVARASEPGCKVDTLPVLIAKQGTYKSSSLRALCPDPEWFADDLGTDLYDKKSAEGLRAKWIIEFSEFSRIMRAQPDVYKSFITRQVDWFRPSYGHFHQNFPRQCVFVATTNDPQPLRDEENRRFLPIACEDGKPEAITAIRDQLWAEAVSLYKAGEKWWTTVPTLEAAIREKQEAARADDAWETIFQRSFAVSHEITVTDIITALEMAPGHYDKSAQTRAGYCLRKLGWTKDRRRAGTGVREYYWYR